MTAPTATPETLSQQRARPSDSTHREYLNLIGGNLRLILIVDGPPPDRALITELNHMRALERVIAQMEHPARTGFERLQRPLSFRMLKR